MVPDARRSPTLRPRCPPSTRTQGLRERELIKLASLAGAGAGALRGRGVDDAAALLTAEAGIAVFKVAFALWVDETNDRELAALVRETLDGLKAMTSFRVPE